MSVFLGLLIFLPFIHYGFSIIHTKGKNKHPKYSKKYIEIHAFQIYNDNDYHYRSFNYLIGGNYSELY